LAAGVGGASLLFISQLQPYQERAPRELVCALPSDFCAWVNGNDVGRSRGDCVTRAGHRRPVMV
jgi:hypothetical protein